MEEYDFRRRFYLQRKRRAQWREEHKDGIQRARRMDLEMLATTVGLGTVIGGSLLVTEMAVNSL